SGAGRTRGWRRRRGSPRPRAGTAQCPATCGLCRVGQRAARSWRGDTPRRCERPSGQFRAPSPRRCASVRASQLPSTGVAEVAAAPPQLEQAIADRYRLERLLGTGGMATVYLAWDLRHERRVALKVLDPELAATLGPERFLREIGIAGRLNHPHVLPMLDSGVSGGVVFSH